MKKATFTYHKNKNMQKIKLIIYSICLCLPTLVFAQKNKPLAAKENKNIEKLKTYEIRLQRLAERVLTDSSIDNRLATNDTLLQVFQEAFSLEGSFEYPFDSIKSISLKKTPDKKIRIATWQLFVNRETYQYFGFLQMPTKKGLNLIPLDDKANKRSNIDFSELGADEWYGALYYNIKEFRYKGKTHYLLFGYDAFSAFDRRKLLDILHFENGKPLFGAPLIHIKDGMGREQTVSRFIMEYSASVMCTLNFSEEEKMIIFDHLIAQGLFKEQGVTNVPDGSYDALKLANGKWVFVEKLPTQVLEDGEAPMPKPILDKRRNSKDPVFGTKSK